MKSVMATKWPSTLTLIALIALCLAWELWLAPLRPGGSWLVLKVVPLLAAFPGVARGRRYTFQWSSMLILAYFIEGTVRAFAETGWSRALASWEIALAVTYFGTAIAHVRLNARQGDPAPPRL